MKNKGFSLIEVIIAVAIIASLSGIVGLNLRKYMANAKDAKVVATLHSIRTAIQIYQFENNDPLFNATSSTSYSKQSVTKALTKLEPYLDNKAKTIINTPEMDIGGSKTEDSEKIKYGGKVRLTFIDPDGGTKTDGFSIWLEPVTGTGPLDIKGNKWIDY